MDSSLWLAEKKCSVPALGSSLFRDRTVALYRKGLCHGERHPGLVEEPHDPGPGCAVNGQGLFEEKRLSLRGADLRDRLVHPRGEHGDDGLHLGIQDQVLPTGVLSGPPSTRLNRSLRRTAADGRQPQLRQVV